MEPERIRLLIKRLVISTQAGKFRWEETADEDIFRLTLDAGIIHIRRIMGKTTIGGPPGDDYMFKLFNQNNALVENFTSELEEDRKLLRDLYEAARASALKPNELLGKLEQEVIRRSG